MNQPSHIPTKTLRSQDTMKQLLKTTSALMLAAATVTVPSYSFSQDAHAGHDHDDHAEEVSGHDHAGHDHEEHSEEADGHDHDDHDHSTEGDDDDAHAGHDHDANAEEVSGHDHDEHDHSAEGDDDDAHAGHDHAANAEEASGHDHDEHDHSADGDGDDAHAEEAIDDHSGHDHAVVESNESHDGHDHEPDAEGHSDEVTLSEDAIRIYNIKTERAVRRPLNSTTTVPARVSYNTEAMAHIGTQVSGRVQEIAVRLGDTVEEGQLLLVIDSPELGAAQSTFLQQDAAVDAASISVEAAQGLVEVARTAFERAEKLRESNGISITDFLERQGALRQAEANVRLAQAALRVAESERLAAENQLHIYGYRHEDCDELLASGEIHIRYEVTAPIAGRVIAREATLGEVVDSSDEALMILANMEELWVLADVPERSIGRLSKGGTAEVIIGSQTIQGQVSFIAPELDQRTRTASVRIVVSGESLKPGMFGEAQLTLDPLAEQSDMELIVVPYQSVLTVEGGPAVFVPVAGEPNTFAKRSVKVGPRVGGFYPVLSGLSEGEEFVATNPFILKADLGKAGAAHVH